MNQFIDIHTHKNCSPKEGFLAIQNTILPEQKVPEHCLSSVGYHPWHLNNLSLKEIEIQLVENLQKKNVVALGECGIDRTIETPVVHQSDIFRLHLNLAHYYSKPLIIHAVRSYSDLLAIFKSLKTLPPLIFHDYRGNAIQSKQLLNYDSYFSFGESLLNSPKIVTNLQALPTNRLFFETDESEQSIEKIYLSAATALNMPTIKLKEQISSNYTRIFGNELVKQN